VIPPKTTNKTKTKANKKKGIERKKERKKERNKQTLGLLEQNLVLMLSPLKILAEPI